MLFLQRKPFYKHSLCIVEWYFKEHSYFRPSIGVFFLVFTVRLLGVSFLFIMRPFVFIFVQYTPYILILFITYTSYTHYSDLIALYPYSKILSRNTIFYLYRFPTLGLFDFIISLLLSSRSNKLVVTGWTHLNASLWGIRYW